MSEKDYRQINTLSVIFVVDRGALVNTRQGIVLTGIIVILIVVLIIVFCI